MINAELLYKTLKERDFITSKWSDEGLDFTEFSKTFKNSIKLEFTICSKNNDFKSYSIALIIGREYAEIAIENIKELVDLITILDK